MALIIKLTLVFAATLAVAAGIREPTEAKITEMPYVVAIEMKDRLGCAGVALNMFWVLTSAACVPNTATTKIIVRAGTNVGLFGGTVHEVDDYRNHKERRSDSTNPTKHDIILLHLATPIEFDDTKFSIQLARKMPTPGEVGQISGFGLTEKDEWWSSLLEARVPIIDKDECEQYYESVDKEVPEGLFCAGQRGGPNACRGDHGGPLVINKKLVGIVSYAEPECNGEIPALFLSVPYYREWIVDSMDYYCVCKKKNN